MNDFDADTDLYKLHVNKCALERLGNAEWMRAVFPDYESLLNFAVSMKMNAVSMACELQDLHTRIDAIDHDNGLVRLLMRDQLPEPVLPMLISRLVARETDSTGQAIARAIAVTRQQQKNKAKHTARMGGLTKAAKLEKLKAETIRLYKMGSWPSAPLAAEQIRPAIVLMSKNGNGDLAASTDKPLAWIREHRKATEK